MRHEHGDEGEGERERREGVCKAVMLVLSGKVELIAHRNRALGPGNELACAIEEIMHLNAPIGL